MMKLKMFALLALTATILSACSESAYTPTSYPYTNSNANGMYTQTGMMPYNTIGYNGMNNNYNSLYAQGIFAHNPYLYSNYSMNASAGFQARAMFSLNIRAMTPRFYQPNYVSNNCMMRRQVTYTPQNCACFQAPCNCQQVVAQIQQQTQNQTPRTCFDCSSTSSNDRTTTTTTTTRTRDDRTTAADRSDETPSTDTTTTPSRPQNRDEIITTNSDKLMSLSLVKEDAQALYDRLAKEEEKIDKKISVRTGSNYKCIYDRNEKKENRYACDFDINLKDGSLYQVYPVGNAGQATRGSNGLFNGSNVEIGGPGLAPEEGSIKFSGKIAATIYNRLDAEAVTGTIDAQNSVQATIKTGTHVKCYKTLNTATSAVECTIKIKSDSGEALSAK